MEECLRLAEQAKYLVPQILTRTDLGGVYASFGDHQRALEQMRLALKEADERVPIFRPYVIGMLARHYLHYQQLGEAETLIEQAKTESNLQHSSFLFHWVTVAEAELALRQGDLERVLAMTDAILAAISQSGMRSLLSPVLLVRGRCFAAMGQLERARATLLEAHADAEGSGSRVKLMQVLVELAKIEADPRQAGDLLQQAKEIQAYILSHSPPDLRLLYLRQRAAVEAR